MEELLRKASPAELANKVHANCNEQKRGKETFKAMRDRPRRPREKELTLILIVILTEMAYEVQGLILLSLF